MDFWVYAVHLYFYQGTQWPFINSPKPLQWSARAPHLHRGCTFDKDQILWLISISHDPQYLNLSVVVLPIIQQQVREASGIWGVLAHAGPVRVYPLERVQVPFPPVAVRVWVHFHVFFCWREDLGNLILPICLGKRKCICTCESCIWYLLKKKQLC